MSLELALSYVKNGWPVFPTRSKEEHDEYGEIFAPKTPYTSNGLKGASLSERIVTEWWRRYPDAMVAVPTGSKIGAFVLDVDNKPGGSNGFDWLEDMEAEHGPLPETARVTTPNGGIHIFFNYVSGTRNRGALGAGVDIRSEGGYVVAAGSKMADGRSYEWSPNAPIADAPDWLLELVVKRDPSPKKMAPYTGTNTPYVNSAVDRELAELASTPQGGRNNALNDSAFSLGTLVGAGALSMGEAESALLSVASQWPNLKLSTGTIKRGLAAGERQPRAIPERHDDNTRLVDVKRMIANGLKKAAARTEDVDADVSISADATAVTVQDTNPIIPGVSVKDSSHGPDEQDAIRATPFTWIDPATLPRREFAYGTHYIRKYVSVTVSPGGLGKTSNSIAEALAMVCGRGLLGVKPPNRMRAWLFNAEDPRDELDRRIMAACLHYKLKPDDLDGLYMDTGREQELVVAIEDKRTGVRYMVPVIEAVIANIKRHAIDVMIVDPFVSTHGVNENDNGAIDKVAKLWAHIADETNCAIDIVHHLRKVADREATVEDARGAVALIGAARSVRVLNRMSPEQAAQAGISENDRTSYFNVHQGKANLTRMSNAQDWRKLESVPLGNGRGLAKPQDHAGVVTEWKWPSAEDVAAEITDAQFADVASLLGGTAYKLTANSKPWAGEAIAAVLGLDPDDKAVRKRCGVLLKAWVDDGRLTVVEERDPHTRHLGKFVRAA